MKFVEFVRDAFRASRIVCDLGLPDGYSGEGLEEPAALSLPLPYPFIQIDIFSLTNLIFGQVFALMLSIRLTRSISLPTAYTL